MLKYIPGIGWQVGGKFYMSQRMLENRKAVAWGMTMEYGLLFAGGTALSIASIPWVSKNLQIEPILAIGDHLGIIWPQIVALIISLFTPLLLHTLTKFVTKSQVNLAPMFLCMATILSGWYLLSLALSLLGSSIIGEAGPPFALYSLAVPVSFMFGLLVIFIPNGFGVRESTMAFILHWALQPGVSVLVALLARLCIAIAELLAFGLISIIEKRQT